LAATRPKTFHPHKNIAHTSPVRAFTVRKKRLPESVARKRTWAKALSRTACFFIRSLTPSNIADTTTGANQTGIFCNISMQSLLQKNLLPEKKDTAESRDFQFTVK
jgi:hypothetical protein